MNRSPFAIPERNGKHTLQPVSRIAAMTPAPSLPEPASLAGAGKVFALDRWLVRRALRQLGDPPFRVVLWNGEEITTSAEPPDARMHLGDRKTFLKLLLDPDLEFGDAYSDGRIEVHGDLVSFLETIFRAESPTAPPGFRKRLLARGLHRPRRNSLSGSRRNIHHHYDLSNDFYRLWLDDQMVYTCAYFPTPSATLEEAQLAKMDHVCRKLRLRPGQTVFEAGCGWGALARHMARHYGVTVRAFNISHEQIAYARERARAEGLSHQVEFIEDDYRAIKGSCDAFASVGMLEHVGSDHYGNLGHVIRRCLKPTGLGLIHTIGRNRPSPTNAWLEQRIFPGAYMPSLSEIMAVFEPSAFSVLDVENLRLHYALTLLHWLRRFDQAAERIAAQFDARLVRAWRLYLASSMAGFTTGFIQLFQIVFAPARNNDIPWTRDHLYAGHRGIANGQTP
jgi:cyclopropane-fatty-acyl-phospholipid synthase